MPKQHNHQHQRRRGGARMRLPWSDPPFVGAPYIPQHPDPWTRRFVPPQRIALVYVGVAVVGVALVFGVALLLMLFSGH